MSRSHHFVPLKIKNLIGKKFGKLTITNTWLDDSKIPIRWVSADCDCGTKNHVLRYGNVYSGASTSCGCTIRAHAHTLGLRRRKHGASKTPLYHYWMALKNTVGMEGAWLEFVDFRDDVKDRPPGLHLIRKDMTKPFSRENNEGWGSPVESRRQGHRARLVTINGETKLAREWADLANISRQAFQQWLDFKPRSEQELVRYISERTGQRRKRQRRSRQRLKRAA